MVGSLRSLARYRLHLSSSFCSFVLNLVRFVGMDDVTELQRCHTLGWFTHSVHNSSPMQRVRKLIYYVESMGFHFGSNDHLNWG